MEAGVDLDTMKAGGVAVEVRELCALWCCREELEMLLRHCPAGCADVDVHPYRVAVGAGWRFGARSDGLVCGGLLECFARVAGHGCAMEDG